MIFLTSVPKIDPRQVEPRERRRGLAERVVALVDDERDRLQEKRDRKGRDEHRRGRLRTERAEDDALHRHREGDHDREAQDDAGPHGPVAVGREREGERPGHHELPVREVDEPEHAEDEADTDGHQRVDGADPDRVDLHLRIDRGAQEVGQSAGDETGHER